MSRFATLFPTLEAAFVRVVGWWQNRSRREQWLLGLLGGLLTLWLVAATVVLPLQRARAAALADIRTYESLTARLRSAGTLGAGPAPAMASGSPNAILSNSAAQFGLLPVVNSDPAGLRVTVADAPYESLIRWIASVEQTSSLRVIRMRLARRPAGGVVSADLLVRA